MKQTAGIAAASLLASSFKQEAEARILPLTIPKKDLHSKIAVLGAGVSGLSCAHYLTKKGYKNVHVIEKTNRVGGKVNSIQLKAPNGKMYPYELGAIVISPPTYKTIMEIINDVRAPLDNYIATSCHLDPENQDQRQRIIFSSAYDSLEGEPHTSLAQQGLELWEAFANNSQIDAMKKVGHGQNRASSHSQSFYEWCKENRLSEGTIKTIERAITGIGYGDIHEVPAAYHMKYFPLHLSIKQLLFSKYLPGKYGKKHLRNGYQSLWNQVAQKLNISLNRDIQEIAKSTSSKNGVEITFQDGVKEHFDYVLVACPFEKIVDRFHHQLINPEFKASNFKKFNYYPMHNFLIEFESKELYEANINTAWFSRYYSQDFTGKPMLIINRHPQNNIYNVYGDGSSGANKEEVLANIEQSFYRLSFKIIDIHAHSLWKTYFPYIGSEDLKQGYFNQLEKLQGKNGLYYLTSRMNFETTEHSAQYGKYIANEFF